LLTGAVAGGWKPLNLLDLRLVVGVAGYGLFLMNRIAVFYLARLAEGFGAFEQFAKSYRAHPSGVQHGLILIAKGFEKEGQLAVLEDIYSDIPHRTVEVSENCGLDIHAYREAVVLVDADTVCFFNSFTRIASDNWLKKLYDNFNGSNVGLVGATASYESLYTTGKLIDNLILYAKSKVILDREVTEKILWLCQIFYNRAFKAYHYQLYRLREYLGAIFHPERRNLSVHSSEPSAEASLFPSFPNPHIRSNAFMISKDRFLQRGQLATKSKLDCSIFESGMDSITRRVMSDGLRALVVGADGIGYDVQDWPKTNCFRTPGQPNLLIRDNQTDQFDRLTNPEQQSLTTMSWGSSDNSEILGVSFVGDIASNNCINSTNEPIVPNRA
jgi:hypothetical protein